MVKETIDGYETRLEAPQVEWVKEGIEARYERSRRVNGPLIGLEDVPEFPPMEAALEAALQELTREQVAYMMDASRAPFSFQMKLVTPGKRLDLQRELINSQPKRMDTPDQKQQDLFISTRVF